MNTQYSTMATKKASKEVRSKSKQPQEQLDEIEKEGRCRRILCDVLTLRVLQYTLKQPPSFTFILTLFTIAGCLPFIGVYITKQKVLPDLDAMQNWNSYIGKLGQNNYCFQIDSQHLVNKTDISSVLPTYPPFNMTTPTAVSPNTTFLTTCVVLEFHVSRDLVLDSNKKIKDMILVANLTGADIGTQIRDKRQRVDDGIYIHFWMLTSKLNISACTDTYCTMNGSVLITAPSTAVPTRLPQVHEDFTFQTKVIHCNVTSRCPLRMCPESFLNLNSNGLPVAGVSLRSDCQDGESQLEVVNKHKLGTKVNGIIRINLNTTDKSTAAYHMYLAAIAIAALGLAFTVSVLLTNRPTEPKTSLE